MPKVGKKKFPYTKKGKAAAKKVVKKVAKKKSRSNMKQFVRDDHHAWSSRYSL